MKEFVAGIHPPGAGECFQEEVRSDDPNLLSMSFNYLMEDSRGNIWFKREKGFGLYLTDRDTFLQVLYTLQPERCFPHINNMVEDKGAGLDELHGWNCRLCRSLSSGKWSGQENGPE